MQFLTSQSDIARGVTDEQLTEAFSIYGKVFEAKVVKNKFTGETKGMHSSIS